MKGLEGATVLIVDDEADIRDVILYKFKSFGAKVLEASDGGEALKLLNAEKIDAVISDIRMPGVDGIELLKQVSAKWPDKKFFLISGYADLAVQDAILLGAENIFTKPFDFNDLVSAVARSLDRILDWA